MKAAIFIITFFISLTAFASENSIFKSYDDRPRKNGFSKVLALSDNYHLHIYETYANTLEVKLFQFNNMLTTAISLGNADISLEQVLYVNLDNRGEKELVLFPFDRSSTYGFFHTVIIFKNGIHWEIKTTHLDRAELREDGKQFYFTQPGNDKKIFFENGFLVER